MGKRRRSMHAEDRHPAGHFTAKARVRLHHVEAGAAIASLPGFASAGMCQALVGLCEADGFQSGTADRENGYEQATADLEVDSHPVVSAWLRAAGLVPAVSAAMLATHGVRPAAFDDIFVVKYHEAQQRALPRHVDAGELSFMLALSSRAAYDGGGTAFDALSPCGDAVPGEPRAPLHLDQGELLLFDAGLYHAGLPITRGTRYLLVGFCHVSAAATRAPGNVGLNLMPIRGCRSAFDLWRLPRLRPPPGRPGLPGGECGRLLAAAQAWYRCSRGSGWVGATQAAPAGSLAAFAQAVLRFHAPRMGARLPGPRGGAEFWVQCLSCGGDDPRYDSRDLPAEGDGAAREGRVGSGGGAAEDTAPPGDVIPWHHDKDELRLRRSGELAFPAVATVTYLSTCGSPTVVFGEAETLVCHPRAGNHLAFAGHLLHGCPGGAPPAATPRAVPAGVPTDPRLRTTLLVNLWPQGPPEGLGDEPPPGDAVSKCARGKGVDGPAAWEPAEGDVMGGACLEAWQEVQVARPALGGDCDEPDVVLRQCPSGMWGPPGESDPAAFALVRSSSARGGRARGMAPQR
eukprot:jgi/Tetstr1/441884/TSEL_030094.t1